MKIKVSYTGEEENDLRRLVELLKPILGRFKVKKSTGTPPYNHLYFISKDQKKA